MLTGFEALGAASAVLQVISYATDITVTCKKAYDGATTSEDDLHRHAKQMSEAVDRLKSRCEEMSNTNASFSTPELNTISRDCCDAAKELQAQVSYVTSLQAKGDIAKALRKAFRTSRRKKKLEDLERSLSRYKQLIDVELQSYLCSHSEAVRLKQESAFQKLDTDVQSLVNQLAQCVTDVQNHVKHEHTITRSAVTQEAARAEAAINSHTDYQVLDLRTTAETKRKCETFLQSLKAPRMNQRYNDVTDSRDASFNQVFATYEDMIDMYGEDSEESGYSTDDYDSENDDNSEDEDDSGGSHDLQDDDDLKDDGDPEEDADTGDEIGEIDSEGYGSSEAASNMSDMDKIYDSWFSFNSWLTSDDKLFYIQGKPGSGKSTLVKFILNQDRTLDLIQEWSSDAIIISYFFWKIGSEEQNSIKGLWCSMLYYRLQDQEHLILNTLQHFRHLPLHSEYHDWSIKDLQDVWNYIAKLDTRHICLFIDGLDEVRDQDGFSKLAQSIQLVSQLPRTKLCVSARPEAQIVRWLRTTGAEGILLEDLTRFDMLQFVRDRFRQLLPYSQVSRESSRYLRRNLVDKTQGVFLWLHLATRSITEGIENNDSEDMLFARLNALPGDLKDLYIDLWQRMNAKSPVYVETARRYLRYVLKGPGRLFYTKVGRDWMYYSRPWIVQIACAENFGIQEKLLKSKGRVEPSEIQRRCEETKASIQSRCAGLLEVRQEKGHPHFSETLGLNGNAFRKVAFIHRTAHDFLTDTEAGQGILGRGPLPDLSTETQLLNGLICTTIVLASERPLSHTSSSIIQQIVDFAKRWGSESLPLATEMLDIVQPLYDRKTIKDWSDAWAPPDPFLSQLTQHDLFDGYVISRLATETSPVLATSVLRKVWDPGFNNNRNKRISKRLFFGLIKLGAAPHEYGISYSPELLPFTAKESAFTNLLISFIILTKGRFEHREDRDDGLKRKKRLETLEIVMHMATTCQNLDKVVSLFARVTQTGSMQIFPLEEVAFEFRRVDPLAFVVFEVNLQFLLLYQISRIGGDLADSVLAATQGQDLLSRINSPLVKIRYIKLLKAKDGNLENDYSSQRTFQRILQQTPLLRSDIQLLFDVEFLGPSQELFVPLLKSEEVLDLGIITEYVKDKETEDVDADDMMISLAAENLGICTCEEAGIAPPYEYLREARERNDVSWELFPLAIGRLETAAAIKEGIEGHE